MVVMEAVTIPALYCPMPYAINPHVEQVHRDSIQWSCDFGLVEIGGDLHRKLEIAKFSWLTALTQPGINREDLKLATDWNIWLFARDDICDDSGIGRDPEQLAIYDKQLLAVLRDGAGADQADPLVRTLYDIRQRVLERSDSEWLRRFAANVKQYFQGNRWEATNRLLGTVPDLATYTKMRHFTGAVFTCFDILAITEDVDVNADFIDHAYVQQLATMANHHICWVNDIFGLYKEIKEGNMNNIVLVLQNELSMTLQEAVNRAIDMCNAEMKAFLVLESRLPSFGPGEDEQLRRYVVALRAWLRGHIDWYAATGRYESTLEGDG